uniref:Uncharacterized protein n=1 Tax=Ixodes ricinus TaxID=34613 RepID=A0A6B0URX1_IXORI
MASVDTFLRIVFFFFFFSFKRESHLLPMSYKVLLEGLHGGLLRRWQRRFDCTILLSHAYMLTPFWSLHSLRTWLKPSQSEMSCWFWAHSRNCFSSYWQAPLSCCCGCCCCCTGAGAATSPPPPTPPVRAWPIV